MKNRLLKSFLSVCGLVLLSAIQISCTPNQGNTSHEPQHRDSVAVDAIQLRSLEDMSLREKVGQMFNVRPEVLNGDQATIYPNYRMKQAFAKYPCGSLTLFGKNISHPNQLKELTAFLHGLGDYPLLCIDEEGGRVARIARENKNYFDVPSYESMWSIGQSGNSENAYEAGSSIGEYLSRYGLDVDFAPVADIWSNPNNQVIADRSFSNDAHVVAQMTGRFYDGLSEHHVVGCYKHFPGHGDTDTDTHLGYAETTKSWEELQAFELIPFQSGIDKGVEMIMVGHVSAPSVTGQSVPATLSYMLLTEKLRGEMGFEGIIITDGMEMGAIRNEYAGQGGEAAIRAIEAGVDIILLPDDYFSTFDAVVSAVEQGRLTEERINQSVTRILALKRELLQCKISNNSK
ncbi:MAG: glycoside hydrolase family 3 protein [Paludibacteraceae bacterium]|nr:glycoside hydrolase family 3 protein [Paludibacteraceae bacterium]